MSEILTTTDGRQIFRDDAGVLHLIADKISARPEPAPAPKVKIQAAIAATVQTAPQGRIGLNELEAKVEEDFGFDKDQVRSNLCHVKKNYPVAISKHTDDATWTGSMKPVLAKTDSAPREKRRFPRGHFAKFVRARNPVQPQSYPALLAEYNKATDRSGNNEMNVSHLEGIKGIMVDRAAMTFQIGENKVLLTRFRRKKWTPGQEAIVREAATMRGESSRGASL
jgi:hypothetical protein